MDNINSELGIPISGEVYTEMMGMDYAYAGGNKKKERKEKRQERREERKENRQERREERKENRQERKEARQGTQRISESDIQKAEEKLMRDFGNSILNAKNIEELDYWIGVMSDQKVDAQAMLGKRKSGVGSVISFGRQYNKRGKNAAICKTNECVRENQAKIIAIDKFERTNNTAITTLRKKLEPKPMPVDTTPKVLVTPTPSPAPTPSTSPETPPVGAALPPIVGGSPKDILLGEESDVAKDGGAADSGKLSKISLGDVSIGKKKIPVLGIVGGLAAVLTGVYFWKRRA